MFSRGKSLQWSMPQPWKTPRLESRQWSTTQSLKIPGRESLQWSTTQSWKTPGCESLQWGTTQSWKILGHESLQWGRTQSWKIPGRGYIWRGWTSSAFWDVRQAQSFKLIPFLEHSRKGTTRGREHTSGASPGMESGESLSLVKDWRRQVVVRTLLYDYVQAIPYIFKWIKIYLLEGQPWKTPERLLDLLTLVSKS